MTTQLRSLSRAQFEWAWQHPDRSRRLKGHPLCSVRSPFHVRPKISALAVMLQSPPWSRFPLSVNFFDESVFRGFVSEFGPQLPEHMSIAVGHFSLERRVRARPSRRDNDEDDEDEDEDEAADLAGLLEPKSNVGAVYQDTIFDWDHENITDDERDTDGTVHFQWDVDTSTEAVRGPRRPRRERRSFGCAQSSLPRSVCAVCTMTVHAEIGAAARWVQCTNSPCNMHCHVLCLARRWCGAAGSAGGNHIVPTTGTCPQCATRLRWGDVLRTLRSSAGLPTSHVAD
jgi:hypothetical protein